LREKNEGNGEGKERGKVRKKKGERGKGEGRERWKREFAP